MRSPFIAALLVTLIALTSTACTGYNKHWKKALANPTASKVEGASPSLIGPWEGTWKSAVNGHTGDLRCIVTPLGDDRYQFHWWASWGKLSGDYKIESMSKPEGDRHLLVMEFDLGKLAGGTYTLDGQVRYQRFQANYHSKADHGTLTLSRPAAAPTTRD